ncbi:MAG: alkaline phosphatase [Victivallaceae bacterium]
MLKQVKGNVAKFVVAATASFVIAGAVFSPTALMAANDHVQAKPAKYIFLFIGDGMSIPQRMFTDVYLKQSGSDRELVMNKLPYQGYSTTYSSDSYITDSAASGTAIATGHKTYSGAIGVDVNKKPLESVAYLAQKKGKKVGIITTTSINHATPAAFYANQHNRGENYKIGKDLIKSGFEYFAGGGFNDAKGTITVKPNGNWGADPDKNKPDLYTLVKEAGITFVDTREGFDKINASTKTPILVKNPHLAAEDTCYFYLDKKPNDIALADYVTKGIEVLDNENGFFIMTEGGKVDWTCHANDIGGTLAEMLSLDDAVKVAYDFAQKHPEETLIVVTGDHETGGMTLGFANTGYKLYTDVVGAQKKSAWAATNDLDAMKQEFKKNKQEFTFEAVKPYITEVFGLKFEGDAKADRMVLNEYELNLLKAAFNHANGGKDFAPTENRRLMYSGYNPIIATCNRILSNKAGIAWTSWDHTAIPVGTSAYGENGEIFAGITDNTDIAKGIRRVLEAK